MSTRILHWTKDKLKLKDMVFEVLREFEDARNCDVTLYERLYAKYFGEEVLLESARSFLDRVRRKAVPDPDNIRRWRAVIQNQDGYWLPTDPEVTRLRKKSEEEWHELMKSERDESSSAHESGPGERSE